MKTINLTSSGITAIQSAKQVTRKKSRLADFESNPEVIAVFERVQTNAAYSLSAAREAFAGVTFRKK